MKDLTPFDAETLVMMESVSGHTTKVDKGRTGFLVYMSIAGLDSAKKKAVAEAVQADRKELRVQKNIKDRYKVFVIDSEEPHQSFYKCEIAGKLEDELADIIIRMLDYCGLKQINMQKLESTKEKLPVGMQNFCDDMFYFCVLITDWPDKYMPNTIAFLINYCESLGIDILWFVEMKMRYNESRPMMHNRRY